MATWKVEPTIKKSIFERNYLAKNNNKLMVETGWRWGEFLVYTEDDNPPNIQAGVDIHNCGYDNEMQSTQDGFWEDYYSDECDDETNTWLEEYLEDGNSWIDLEYEHGWVHENCEMIIECDLKMTKMNQDGSESDIVIVTN